MCRRSKSRTVWERPGEHLRLRFTGELRRGVDMLTFVSELNGLMGDLEVYGYLDEKGNMEMGTGVSSWDAGTLSTSLN